MKKILITGVSGLLGSNLAKVASDRAHVCGTYFQHQVGIKDVQCIQVDLSGADQMQRLDFLKPDVIIHTAALTNVDFCENHPQEAYRHNVLATKHIAEYARKNNAYLIHISTDTVFDGEKGDYKEDDKIHPLSVYGKTKLEAEREVLSSCPQSCVARTVIYGWNKQNKLSLAEWMIDKLEKKEEVPGFKDIFFSPILVNTLSLRLLQLAQIQYQGVLHLTGRESCTKLQFAHRVAKIFGLDEGLIRPINSDEIPGRAPRPRNSTLNVSKAEQLLKTRLSGIDEDLKEMKRLRENGYVQRLKDEKF